MLIPLFIILLNPTIILSGICFELNMGRALIGVWKWNVRDWLIKKGAKFFPPITFSDSQFQKSVFGFVCKKESYPLGKVFKSSFPCGVLGIQIPFNNSFPNPKNSSKIIFSRTNFLSKNLKPKNTRFHETRRDS